MSLRDDGISQGNTTEDIFLIPTQNAQLTLDSCLHDLFLDICGDDVATNGDRGLRAQFSALRMKQSSQKSGHKNQTTFVGCEVVVIWPAAWAKISAKLS